jgi:hypothetical protein
MSNVVSIPYNPREQFMSFHDREQRWACIVAHRRAGKTVATVNDIVTRALYTRKPAARYSYIAPFYSQAKTIAWEYLRRSTENIALKQKESELSVVLPNEATIRLFGADNPDALRGTYHDGAVLDEYGDMKPSVWSKIVLPALADRRGWATFIGTPKGKNHFYKIRERARTDPNWYYLELRASQSGILDEMELEEMRDQMDEDEYSQEFECSFDAALKGAIYGKEMRIAEEQGRVSKDLRLDPDQPVPHVFDLGYTDDTATWGWQRRPGGYVLVSAYHNNFQPTEHYIEWLFSRPYQVGDVWLPHDAKAKSLQTGKSIVEQFLAAGITPRLVPNLSLKDGISAARKILPYCHFIVPETYDGVEALKQYQRTFDETTKAFIQKPKHDWTSHYADSFRYFSLSVEHPNKEVVSSSQRVDENGMTLDGMFEERELTMRRGTNRI